MLPHPGLSLNPRIGINPRLDLYPGIFWHPRIQKAPRILRNPRIETHPRLRNDPRIPFAPGIRKDPWVLSNPGTTPHPRIKNNPAGSRPAGVYRTRFEQPASSNDPRSSSDPDLKPQGKAHKRLHMRFERSMEMVKGELSRSEMKILLLVARLTTSFNRDMALISKAVLERETGIQGLGKALAAVARNGIQRANSKTGRGISYEMSSESQQK